MFDEILNENLRIKNYAERYNISDVKTLVNRLANLLIHKQDELKKEKEYSNSILKEKIELENKIHQIKRKSSNDNSSYYLEQIRALKQENKELKNKLKEAKKSAIANFKADILNVLEIKELKILAQMQCENRSKLKRIDLGYNKLKLK